MRVAHISADVEWYRADYDSQRPHLRPLMSRRAKALHESTARLPWCTILPADSGRSEDAEGHDLSFSDFAVLYRTDAQVPALVEALHRSGMPFQHRSHRRLLDHPGVAAAVDVLREAPRPGSVRERLEAVCIGDGRRDALMLEACELLRPAAVACGEDLERFLSDLSLGTEADTWDPRADRISLLTLHASKGLACLVALAIEGIGMYAIMAWLEMRMTG